MEVLETAFRELVEQQFGGDTEEQQLSEIEINNHDLLELVTEIEDKFEVSFDHDELEQVEDAGELLQLLLFRLLLTSCQDLVEQLETEDSAKAETDALTAFVGYLEKEKELLSRNMNKLQSPANLLPLLYNLVNYKKEEIQDAAGTALQILEGA